MKYSFVPDRPNTPAAKAGGHVRLADNVRGTLREFPDTVTVRPEVDPSGFVPYVAPEPTPEPAPEPIPEPVPYEISLWRAKAVLAASGLLETVEAMIVALPAPDGDIVRLAWNNAAPLVRDGATIAALAPQMGLTDEQIDNMFRQAANLTV